MFLEFYIMAIIILILLFIGKLIREDLERMNGDGRRRRRDYIIG